MCESERDVLLAGVLADAVPAAADFAAPSSTRIGCVNAEIGLAIVFFRLVRYDGDPGREGHHCERSFKAAVLAFCYGSK